MQDMQAQKERMATRNSDIPAKRITNELSKMKENKAAKERRPGGA